MIPNDEVEKFKNDVKLRPGTDPSTTPSTTEEAPTNNTAEKAPEAPPHGNDNTACTDNWTAANSFKEDTVQVFDQTGIFLCACRHSIVETIVEMRHSGEL